MAKKTKNEESSAPSNTSSGGSIAGLPPDEPVVKKKKKKAKRSIFAGCDVFDVSSDVYMKCKGAKGRYERYVKFVGEDSVGQEIREFGRSSPGKPIILRDSKYKTMTFLRYGKYKTL